MSRPRSKSKNMDLLKTILDEEDSDQQRRSKIGLSSRRHAEQVLVKKYHELQELLLSQYVESQASLQQQFLQTHQSASALGMPRSAPEHHGNRYSYHSEGGHRDGHRPRRVKSAGHERKPRSNPDPGGSRAKSASWQRKTEVQETAYADEEFEDVDEDIEEVVIVEEVPVQDKSEKRRERIRFSSSSSASDSQDSHSDDDLDHSGDRHSTSFKRVSFSAVLDSDTTDKELYSSRSTQQKGILKYSSPRDMITYTYPAPQTKSRNVDNDEVRRTTSLLSMLHIPAARLGLPHYDPSMDRGNRRVANVRRKKFRRELKMPPPMSMPLSPGVLQVPSPRPPKEVQHSDHKLGDSKNPELLTWLKKKNAMLRKQRREKRKKEREERRAEQKESEKKIERMVEAEDIYTDWLKKTKKQTLLMRRKQKQKKLTEKEMMEKEQEEKAKRLEELKAKEAKRKAAMATKTKKDKHVTTEQESEGKEGEGLGKEGTKEGQGSGEGDKKAESSDGKSDEQGKENQAEAQGKRPPRKARNKVHPASADIRGRSRGSAAGARTSNSGYRHRRPGSAYTQKTTTPNNRPSSAPSQAKKKPNPMAGMTYDQWLQQKRKDDNSQKLREEAKKAKELWTDPTLDNIIPKLAKERIERATAAKLKVDTGLKKSPRDARSPSPTAKRSSLSGSETSDGSPVRNYTWKTEDTGKEQPKPPAGKPRPASATNGKPPTPPLSGRPGSGGRRPKSAASKMQKTERPEPQGCEITDEQQVDQNAQQNDAETNQMADENSGDDDAANEKGDAKSDSKDADLGKASEAKESSDQGGLTDQSDGEIPGKNVNTKDGQSESPEESHAHVDSQSGNKDGGMAEANSQSEVKETQEKESTDETSKTVGPEADMTPRTKSRVSFNLGENVTIPPSDSDQEMEEKLRTANLVDDFLRKESSDDSNGGESKVSSTNGENFEPATDSVFMTETSDAE